MKLDARACGASEQVAVKVKVEVDARACGARRAGEVEVDACSAAGIQLVEVLVPLMPRIKARDKSLADQLARAVNSVSLTPPP